MGVGVAEKMGSFIAFSRVSPAPLSPILAHLDFARLPDYWQLLCVMTIS